MEAAWSLLVELPKLFCETWIQLGPSDPYLKTAGPSFQFRVPAYSNPLNRAMELTCWLWLLPRPPLADCSHGLGRCPGVYLQTSQPFQFSVPK